MSETPHEPVTPLKAGTLPATASPPRRRRGSRLWPFAAVLGWSLLALTLAAGGWLLWTGKLRLSVTETPPYEASMEFFIEPVAFKPSAQDGEPSSTSFHRFYAAMLRSHVVLSAALKKPGIADLPSIQKQADPVEWLERNLQVDSYNGPAFMYLKLAGDDPEELKMIVSAVTGAYMREIVLKDYNKHLSRIGKLQDLAQRYEDRIAEKKRTMNQLIARSNVPALKGPKTPEIVEQQLKAALELKNMAERELVQARADNRKRQHELDHLQAREKALPNEPMLDTDIEEALLADPRIRELLDQEVKTTVMIKILPAEEAKAQRTKLQAIKKALEEFRQELRPQIEKQLRERHLSELKRMQDDLKPRISFAAAYVKELEAEIQRLDQVAEANSAVTVDLAELREAIVMDEGVVKQARAEAHKMELERQSAPRVRLLEEEVIVRKLR